MAHCWYCDQLLPCVCQTDGRPPDHTERFRRPTLKGKSDNGGNAQDNRSQEDAAEPKTETGDGN